MKASVRELNGRHIQDETARLAALLDQARDHAIAFRNREGLNSAREALNIARRRHDNIAVGRALGTATICHYQRADYVAAVATGLDAIAACADGDALGRSLARQSIALALFSVEAYETAQAMADQAVLDAIAAGDQEREALSRGVFAMLLAERGEFEAARRQFRASAHYYKGAANVLRLKVTTSNLGHTYRKQGHAEAAAGRPSQARLYWTQALRIYRLAYAAVRHDASDAVILGAIAECECSLGRIEAAYADVGHALEVSRKLENATIRANCYLWEGHILEAMGEPDDAERSYERACEAGGSLEHAKVPGEALRALAKLLDKRGHADRARQLEERAVELESRRQAFFVRVRDELGPIWDRLIDFHA
jgi:tetratricopeptide (TPR) repeat protein